MCVDQRSPYSEKLMIIIIILCLHRGVGGVTDLDPVTLSPLLLDVVTCELSSVALPSSSFLPVMSGQTIIAPRFSSG